MAKSENKTTENDGDVLTFLRSIKNDKRREDGLQLFEIIKDLVPDEPRMWGKSIVGFGSYHYVYESGREGDSMKLGFSPRSASLTIYIVPGFPRFDDLMEDLGKYKTGKSCLYIKKIEDVDLDVLKQLMTESYNYMTEKYG